MVGTSEDAEPLSAQRTQTGKNEAERLVHSLTEFSGFPLPRSASSALSLASRRGGEELLDLASPRQRRLGAVPSRGERTGGIREPDPGAVRPMIESAAARDKVQNCLAQDEHDKGPRFSGKVSTGIN